VGHLGTTTRSKRLRRDVSQTPEDSIIVSSGKLSKEETDHQPAENNTHSTDLASLDASWRQPAEHIMGIRPKHETIIMKEGMSNTDSVETEEPSIELSNNRGDPQSNEPSHEVSSDSSSLSSFSRSPSVRAEEGRTINAAIRDTAETSPFSSKYAGSLDTEDQAETGDATPVSGLMLNSRENQSFCLSSDGLNTGSSGGYDQQQPSNLLPNQSARHKLPDTRQNHGGADSITEEIHQESHERGPHEVEPATQSVINIGETPQPEPQYSKAQQEPPLWRASDGSAPLPLTQQPLVESTAWGSGDRHWHSPPQPSQLKPVRNTAAGRSQTGSITPTNPNRGNNSPASHPRPSQPAAFYTFAPSHSSEFRPAKRRGRNPSMNRAGLAYDEESRLSGSFPETSTTPTDSPAPGSATLHQKPTPAETSANHNTSPIRQSIALPHISSFDRPPGPSASRASETHGHDSFSRPSNPPPRRLSPRDQKIYRPPAVMFTIDNRAESQLLTNEVQSLIETFTQHAKVIAPTRDVSQSVEMQPIGVIMWQSLPSFYKWYSEFVGPYEHGPLRFELKDVDWQSERSFVVPPDKANYYRTLKQYIWDLFWTASNMKGGPTLFRVVISAFPMPPEAITPGNSHPSAWNAVNTNAPDTPSALPNFLRLENIIVSTDSRPGAPTSNQHPVLSRPPHLLPAASPQNMTTAPSAHHPKDMQSIMVQPSGPPSRPLDDVVPRRSEEAKRRKSGTGTLGLGSSHDLAVPTNNTRTDRDIRGLIETAQAIARHPLSFLTCSDILPRFLAAMMLSSSRANQASTIDSHTKWAQRSVEQ
jgi:hypothetical protein